MKTLAMAGVTGQVACSFANIHQTGSSTHRRLAYAVLMIARETESPSFCAACSKPLSQIRRVLTVLSRPGLDVAGGESALPCRGRARAERLGR